MKLDALQTPALLLDKKKFEANCKFLKDKAHSLGVIHRPHLKTGKCKEFARIQMDAPEGPATVSTLLEAEKFADWGVKDMIYAVGLTPSKFERVADLRKKGVDLKVILDNVDVAKKLSEFCKKTGNEIPVLIEIDCDGHRSGVKEGDPTLLEIAKSLTDGAKLVGVLTHAG
ncbi:MAG: alanine racemase, partial [Burkholderiales bacterium]|nr:alanine racemase [Burkholderiales bacterium]